MMTLTSKELNSAYTKVNEIYKNSNGRDTSLPVIVWLDEKELQFKWDSTVGQRGAWIIASEFEIDFEEDSVEEYNEDRDDYDYHL